MFNRELVPTSRIVHFYRSDALSITAHFLLRGSVGKMMLKYHVIEHYRIYVCRITQLANNTRQGKTTLDWRNVCPFACLYTKLVSLDTLHCRPLCVTRLLRMQCCTSCNLVLILNHDLNIDVALFHMWFLVLSANLRTLRLSSPIKPHDDLARMIFR